jgi:hypothetical protein
MNLKGLDILSGYNGTGKSAFIEALTLCKYFWEGGGHDSVKVPHIRLWDTELRDMGTFKELLYNRADEQSFTVKWGYKEDLVDNSCTYTDYSSATMAVDLHCADSLAVDYLGAVRNFDKADAFDYFKKNFDSSVPGDFIFPIGFSELPRTVHFFLDSWASYIMGMPYRIEFTGCHKSLERVRYCVGSKKVWWVSPNHSGSGVNNLLPILLRAIFNKAVNPDTLMVVENPEMGLHPIGQRRLGEFFAVMHNAGLQFILETNNEHLLNGISLAVKSGKVSADKVGLHHFYWDDEYVRVQTPQMLSDGSLSDHPVGFFDEWENGLDELLSGWSE